MNDLWPWIAGAGFPLVFAGFWLAVTTLIGFMSGWYALARRYPDRKEPALLRLTWQAGFMGPLRSRYRGALTLSACRSGLRVGVIRLLGPFSRDFFVPWEEIRVERKDGFFEKLAELTFDEPRVGTLAIRAAVADKLAKAVGDDWPE